MLVRRAAASILKSNSRIASVHRLALPRPIFTFPARAVRNFGSTSTLSNTSNSTNSPFSKHSINMGGKGVLIAVKPDGTPHSSSSSNEALSSLGLEASALSALWKTSNAKPRPAEVRLFYGQGSSKDTTVALVGVGKVDGLNKDALLERTRTVAATGVKALREVGCTEVQIDASTEGLDPHSAAVAVQLALHKFDWKTSKADLDKKIPVSVSLLTSSSSSSGDAKNLDWNTGETFAYSQNLARELMDTPANMMTPTIFAERAKKEFTGIEGITLNVHDEAWAKEKKMNTFLSVAAGTEEPAKFVEIIYKGAKEGGDATDVAFVGKGITFDSGGISLKPGAGMKEMRADMGGAACVLSSMLAISKLKIPINMVVCIPLTENMPSGKATKPGDIIVSMAGKTIEVDNTDAEGRLVLADALYYASSVYQPKVIIDVATLTGAMMIALGDVYAGAFVTSDKLWDGLRTAGLAESDEFWRMPFDDKYLQYINKAGSDLVNTGGRAGGSCTAAIFLKQFVDGLQPDESAEGQAGAKDKETIEYAHIDIAGIMDLSHSVMAYDVKGMSGKPVRALTEYIRRRAYKL